MTQHTFLSPPSEIRLRIYEFILNGVICPTDPSWRKGTLFAKYFRTRLPVLHTCQLLRNEGWPIFKKSLAIRLTHREENLWTVPLKLRIWESEAQTLYTSNTLRDVETYRVVLPSLRTIINSMYASSDRKMKLKMLELLNLLCGHYDQRILHASGTNALRNIAVRHAAGVRDIHP